MIFIKINLGFFHGIIHPVMNIKTRKILITHPTSPHIRFISQNQGGGYWIHGSSRTLVMITDSTDDHCNLRRVHPHPVQQSECHYRTTLCMVNPVHDIANIVHIPGNLGQFGRSLRVIQS